MKRKSFNAGLKAAAVIEAIRGEKTINQIAADYGVHPNQLYQWKKQALEALPGIFTDRRSQPDSDLLAERDRLYQQIGRLQVELDWLKKKIGFDT
jgi:transposase-like protein